MLFLCSPFVHMLEVGVGVAQRGPPILDSPTGRRLLGDVGVEELVGVAGLV